MITLTEKDAALLDALARYRLLTRPQAQRLGLGDYSHISERLRALTRAKLVKGLEMGRSMGNARVHWLTSKGAEVANELAADKGEPGGTLAAAREYVTGPHLRQRVAIVDCHIALRQWAATPGAAVEWFRVEFEPNTQGKLEKALKYPYESQGKAATYEPDAVGVVRTAEGMRWLFGLEVETGGEAESLGNFQRRLEARLDAFASFALEQGLDWNEERRARLLFVFSTADMMAKAQRWAKPKLPPDLHLVFFASLPALQTSWASAWQKIDGKQAWPFAINKTP